MIVEGVLKGFGSSVSSDFNDCIDNFEIAGV